MKRVHVLPIVEGHGEDQSIRILITRIWIEILGRELVNVLRPIRRPRNRLIKEEELKRAIKLAASKLRAHVGNDDVGMILVLLDADEDAPCILGPQLLGIARTEASSFEVSCVLAKVEYETWFVAAADSLRTRLVLGQGEDIPGNPEEARQGKRWVASHFSGTRYSETVDQPALTQAMDLALCRQNSPSFDKLCRDLGRL